MTFLVIFKHSILGLIQDSFVRTIAKRLIF